MGDPKKLKKNYWTQAHPWNKQAIETGKKLKQEYGLKNTKEILIASSFLKKYKTISKQLTAHKTAQKEKEKAQVLGKLARLGLLPVSSELYQILTLEIKNVLERRLQSMVCRKGLARSMNQARQFIIHRHIVIGEMERTSPSYLVSLEEESQIRFKPKSTLASEDHPERVRKPVESVEQAAQQTSMEAKTSGELES
ncbi:30S ribosomal protein S4 [Candidatus Woesearchaeota archaeon]|nr:30S ribosomal protein S4 [Candidatus Woesearchaeota archaeon]